MIGGGRGIPLVDPLSIPAWAFLNATLARHGETPNEFISWEISPVFPPGVEGKKGKKKKKKKRRKRKKGGEGGRNFHNGVRVGLRRRIPVKLAPGATRGPGRS